MSQKGQMDQKGQMGQVMVNVEGFSLISFDSAKIHSGKSYMMAEGGWQG